MDKQCLDFFQARSREPLELTHVTKTSDSISFMIQNPNGDMCISLSIKNDLSFMYIGALEKCSLSGTQSITAAIEFAKDQFIQTLKLTDMSEINYYVSGKMFPIPLKELTMLSTGYTWYEKFGFRNGFEQYRDRWIDCIHKPFHEHYEGVEKPIVDQHKALLAKLSNYADGPIKNVFKQINVFLKKCPKKEGNQCNSSVLEKDLIFLKKFIEKSFELLMMVVLDINHVQLYRQLYFYSDYFLPLYFSNETWVHSEGSIGKVVGIQPGHYKIEFSDGLKEVPIQRVKKLQKVLYTEGIEARKVKIVGRVMEGYVIESGKESEKKIVPFETIKIIGGRKTKRRVWTNQSLRLDLNR